MTIIIKTNFTSDDLQDEAVQDYHLTIQDMHLISSEWK